MNYSELKTFVIEEYQLLLPQLGATNAKKQIANALLVHFHESEKYFQNRMSQVNTIIYHYEKKMKGVN